MTSQTDSRAARKISLFGSPGSWWRKSGHASHWPPQEGSGFFELPSSVCHRRRPPFEAPLNPITGAEVTTACLMRQRGPQLPDPTAPGPVCGASRGHAVGRHSAVHHSALHPALCRIKTAFAGAHGIAAVTYPFRAGTAITARSEIGESAAMVARADLQGGGTAHKRPLPSRSRRQRWPALLPASTVTVLAALLQGPPMALAVPAGGITTPLPTRVERFNPDQQVCLPETIRASFATQLLPWADQPAAVLAQLRRVQLEMTQATLQRCVSKGLLQADQASELERQLGLEVPGGAAGASAAP